MKALTEFGRSIVARSLARTGFAGKTSASAARKVANATRPAPALGRDSLVLSGGFRVPGPEELVRRSHAARQALGVIERHLSRKTATHDPLATRAGRERLASELLDVLQSHHPYTAGHVQRVREYSKMLGEAIGLRGPELERLELGAVLHDIGKTAVPRSILQKTGNLTQLEFEIMKHHTTIGADHLLGRVKEFEPLLSIVRGHHERPAGGGYPLGLKGAEIDPLAKIVSVADAFDAMTSTRSYRPGMSTAKAYERLRQAAAVGQLDAKLVETFITTFERKRGGRVLPVGTKFLETATATG